MKFNVSSTTLLQTLQNASKVISGKNALPILDYFLFEITDDKLRVTASDSEIILRSEIDIVNEDAENGSLVVPSKRLLESLKELPEQPLTFDIDLDTWDVTVVWSSGKLKLVTMSATGYPEIQGVGENFSQISMPSELLETGFSNTIFAAEQSSQLRPVMQGVLMEIDGGLVTFVGTNGQHLAKFEVGVDQQISEKASLIIPGKTVGILRSIAAKDSDFVTLQFDPQNILFKFSDTILISRLIEGNYPRYRQVIPTDNPRKAVVDRAAFLSAVKRVAVSCSPVNGLVQLIFSTDMVYLKCQDISFGTSAEDKLNIQYNDEAMEIGFKAQYLLEVFSNMDSEEIEIQISDAVRPGVFVPCNQPAGEDFLVVLMPITLN